ncbi:hypothetical protein [Tenacibaculum caenipelagi]|uniref:Uncharacterized protein n=1 Tax=Tenacibaculum caenipelagi TaxID=1325435 RepID=A0A4R6TB19_9FLAO|nr:hypothetical protein [Tenacibaculum caenipelagi]TDQ22759.1 hypothetical protein DFQ07_2777 [Tenacibaculum caenipelagi]
MTKNDLYAELYFIPYRDVRAATIKTVAENRKLPREVARWKRIIYPNEVKIIKESLGVEPDKKAIV